MNGILLVNKEEGYTSRDVVNILTKIFNTKKIGHTGTLDPIAKGVLVCTIGKATKLCDLLTSKYKEYIATIKIGIKTDTLDTTGKILEERNCKTTEQEIIKVLSSFKGKSKQEVPLYSAIKVNGKKLYEYARNNIEIKPPTKEIDIKEISLMSYNNNSIVFRCTVSKGTYIRSLIRDICNKLDIIGTMSELIRTKQGNFSIENSYTLEEIKNNKYKLLSYDEALIDIEEYNINKELYLKVCNGSIIDKEFKNDIALIKYNNEVIAIYKVYEKDKNKAKPYIMLV